MTILYLVVVQRGVPLFVVSSEMLHITFCHFYYTCLHNHYKEQTMETEEI